MSWINQYPLFHLIPLHFIYFIFLFSLFFFSLVLNQSPALPLFFSLSMELKENNTHIHITKTHNTIQLTQSFSSSLPSLYISTHKSSHLSLLSSLGVRTSELLCFHHYPSSFVSLNLWFLVVFLGVWRSTEEEDQGRLKLKLLEFET